MVATRKSLPTGARPSDTADDLANVTDPKALAVLRTLQIDARWKLGGGLAVEEDLEESDGEGEVYHYRGAVYQVTKETKKEWIEASVLLRGRRKGGGFGGGSGEKKRGRKEEEEEENGEESEDGNSKGRVRKRRKESRSGIDGFGSLRNRSVNERQGKKTHSPLRAHGFTSTTAANTTTSSSSHITLATPQHRQSQDATSFDFDNYDDDDTMIPPPSTPRNLAENGSAAEDMYRDEPTRTTAHISRRISNRRIAPSRLSKQKDPRSSVAARKANAKKKGYDTDALQVNDIRRGNYLVLLESLRRMAKVNDRIRGILKKHRELKQRMATTASRRRPAEAQQLQDQLQSEVDRSQSQAITVEYDEVIASTPMSDEELQPEQLPGRQPSITTTEQQQKRLSTRYSSIPLPKSQAPWPSFPPVGHTSTNKNGDDVRWSLDFETLSNENFAQAEIYQQRMQEETKNQKRRRVRRELAILQSWQLGER